MSGGKVRCENVGRHLLPSLTLFVPVLEGMIVLANLHILLLHLPFSAFLHSHIISTVGTGVHFVYVSGTNITWTKTTVTQLSKSASKLHFERIPVVGVSPFSPPPFHLVSQLK